MSKRVLIVTIPRQDVTKPPGILSILAACCEDVGYDYDILDLNLHMYKTLPEEQVIKLNSSFAQNQFSDNATEESYRLLCEYLHKRIVDYKPDYVAISVFTDYSLLATDYLLKYLQQFDDRNCYEIVLGGVAITTWWPDTDEFGTYILNSHLADHVIRGEGEISFTELLKGNLDYPGIDGKPAVQIDNLDVIPTPSYKKINPTEYYYSDTPEIIVTSSKGCVRRCSFCDVGAFWKKYRYRSGERMADDLYQIYQDTGVTKFDFTDSLINGSKTTFRRFNKRLIELQSRDPNFKVCYKGQFICRPVGQLTVEDYEDMARAGAETLIVGIEHFSEPIRNHMKKHFNNDAIDWHLEQCARLGIKNAFLLLSGYVTETADDHLLQLEGLKRYQKYALTRSIYAIGLQIDGLQILKGSPLYETADDVGLRTDDNWDTWININNLDLTPRERLRRAVELMYTAGKLGYQIKHFKQKMSDIEHRIKKLKNKKDQIDLSKMVSQSSGPRQRH